MPTKAATLGQYVADLMAKHDHTNRSLATAAGVSESAVRNLLKFGNDKQAKDPDARTITRVAKALDIDALHLFRLAGYIGATPADYSVRAEYLAGAFDQLSPEKQDAVLGVLEAMTEHSTRKAVLQQMRVSPDDSLAGIDLEFEPLLRILANYLIVQGQVTDPQTLMTLPDDTHVLKYRWSSLPPKVQERVRALVRHKLALDYDPVMVEAEWRE